jgi:plastocyanin
VSGLVLVVLTACGSSSPGPEQAAAGATSAVGSASSAGSSAAPSPSAAEAVIHIQGFRYDVPVSVSPGATVSVMNMDGEAHTVTADEGKAFDVTAAGNASGSFTAPTTPGTYAFHCSYHSTMHGSLVVK